MKCVRGSLTKSIFTTMSGSSVLDPAPQGAALASPPSPLSLLVFSLIPNSVKSSHTEHLAGTGALLRGLSYLLSPTLNTPLQSEPK